jgi:hypothetical protein
MSAPAWGDRRRLRRAAAILAGVLGAAALVGATAPPDDLTTSVPSRAAAPDAGSTGPGIDTAPAIDTAAGITVAGTRLLRDGEPWLPRGFNLIGLLTPQWCDREVGVAARDHFGADELAAARAWGADALRFQVSQRGLADPSVPADDRAAYLAHVVDGVAQARAAGFAVVVSMQDQYYGCGDVHPLPSAETVAAWTALVPALPDDPALLLELFNEPRNEADAPGWAQWRDGGSSPDRNLGDPAVGHQALVDHVRELGSTSVLIADVARLGARSTGLPLLEDPLDRLAYGIHPYYYVRGESWWDDHYGDLAAVAPVLATEWNHEADGCGTDYQRLAPDLLEYLRAHGIGVFGHAFDVPGTTVADWSWTPTECGTASGGSGALLREFFLSPDEDPGPPADTTPPSAPAPLDARVLAPGSVRLTWPAATDDVGVAGYRVLRDGAALTTVTARTWTDTAAPSGAHTYAVAALDAAGNASDPAPATALVPAAAQAGLTGTYFDTATFGSRRTARVDRRIDFSWGTGRPVSGVAPDTFSVRWTGKLLAPADGTWTFTVASDEGVRLWVDDRLVVDDWTAHRAREVRGTVVLTDDRAHDVRIEYFERSGPASVRLLWSGPGTARQVVPSSALLSR